MSPEPLIVVGAGPGGLASARSYRQAGGEVEVILLADEGIAPYQRPALSKEYLRGETDRDDLALEDDSFYAEQRVTLVTASARALDPERRLITLDSGEQLAYSACVLACGSASARPDIPGLDDPDVLFLRSLADSDRLARRAARAGVRVVVLGSGFIGCEAAASLAMCGAQVTLATDEPAPQHRRLGPEVGERIAGWLRELGVELAVGSAAASVQPAETGHTVVLEDGRRLAGDVVLAALGARPRIALAEAAGLELAGGAVACDSALRTSAPGVWAVGDIAAARHPIAGRRIRVEHWGDALTHGEVAGRTIAGESVRWDSAPGFWSTIGARTLKYAAWGDGHDVARFAAVGDGAFAVRYERDGALVGALAHEHDEHYEAGQRELENAG